jgi:phosphatidylinositol alpha-mannosyltransferase
LPELDDGKLNILFVGRLEKRKGLRYLLGAFQRLKARRPDVRLVIVGAYTERQRRAYESWVHANRLKDVVFAGYVSLEMLPRYHHSAAVFCAPNTGNESQGIILLEAMAAGRPVVASNIDGFAEVIASGVDGLLVRRKDEEALAEALLSLIEDDALRHEMGERARERAMAYSWDRVSRRVLSYYERLDYERHYPSQKEPELVES